MRIIPTASRPGFATCANRSSARGGGPPWPAPSASVPRPTTTTRKAGRRPPTSSPGLPTSPARASSGSWRGAGYPSRTRPRRPIRRCQRPFVRPWTGSERPSSPGRPSRRRVPPWPGFSARSWTVCRETRSRPGSRARSRRSRGGCRSWGGRRPGFPRPGRPTSRGRRTRACWTTCSPGPRVAAAGPEGRPCQRQTRKASPTRQRCTRRPSCNSRNRRPRVSASSWTCRTPTRPWRGLWRSALTATA